MLSVKKISDGLYVMKNYECTDTRAMLDSEATSTDGLLNWILANHYYGMPNIFDINKEHLGFGCATFAASTSDG